MARASTSAYVELHAHSGFSFGDGASQPAELVAAAVHLGYSHLALTDHDNLCGALEFAHAARDAGIVPITGAELTVVDALQRTSHVTVLVRTAGGYRNLCRLLTAAYQPRSMRVLHAREQAAANPDVVARALLGDAPAGRPTKQASRARGSAERPNPMVTLAQLVEHAEGLVILTGCARSGLLIPDVRDGRIHAAAEHVRLLQRAAGLAHVYIELQLPHHRGDGARNRGLRQVAELTGAAVVATGNIHAHSVERARVHDVLVAIRCNGTLEACEGERFGNLAPVLRSPEQMARRFADHRDAVAATRRIAESIEFDITSGLGYRYPALADASGRGPDMVLAERCRGELEGRYAGSALLLQARGRLEQELEVVRRHGLSGFFLLHADILDLAREVALDIRGPGSIRSLNPPGRGRGSSVESIICYLTGLSHIDPLQADLRMGRFLNDELVSMPDIDLDFPRDIRHELLRRVVGRYGADRCAMVAAHGTYRVRSAIRDVGAALGLPPAELVRIAQRTDARDARYVGEVLGAEHTGPRWDAFRMVTAGIADLPRHIGQHSGGVIVATDPLNAIVPIQPAAMPGRQICQWDKDSCADAGFLKIDVLGLGMLSSVEECVEQIHITTGDAIDLSRIDYTDRRVYEQIQDGDTVGTFQIESRAQIGSIKRTKPQSLHDLTIQVALIRPGPIIGKSVNPYVQLREAQRVDPTVQPTYAHPLLEPVLRDTYGAIIFQDQVIEVAMAIAGFTAGEADGLRRAMTRKRAAGSVEVWRPRFVEGAARRGVDERTANGIFEHVIGFCHYGFPRAHSVAFAVLAYQSAWLRCHYPAQFHAALMNAQPMGFYPPDSLLRDAARHGVGSAPVDINASGALCGAERVGDGAWRIRIGLAYVRGLAHADAVALEQERERGGSYRSIDDLARRAPLRTDQLERLVMAGACDSLGGSRRELLWQLGLVARPAAGGQAALELAAPEAPELAQLSLWDEVSLDFATQGLSTRAHPVELLRPLMPGVRSIVDAAAARGGTMVEVVGAVIARQKPPTAKGVVFLLLEDETGTANVIIGRDLYRRQRVVVRSESVLRVRGRMERQGDVWNIVAYEVHRLPEQLRARAPQRLRAKNFG